MRNHDPVDPNRRMMLDLDDGHVHMHVTSALLFEAETLRTPDGGIDIESIRRWVASKLPYIPHAQQRIVETPIEGRPVWVDDRNFNLQYHVRHTHLPNPGDERQLKRLCGQIASQELDREKPLWELWVVEGVAGERFAVIAKAHQCMTGGVWSFDLVDRLLTPEPESVPDTTLPWYPRPMPTEGELLAAAARRRLGAPLSAARRALDRVRAEGRDVGERIGAAVRGVLTPEPSSETVLNQPIGPHRRVDWMVTPRDVTERIAAGLEVSEDAVVTASIAAAVGHFLERRGTPIAWQKDLTIRVCEPVNAGGLRAPQAETDAFGWMVAELPITDLDPVQRVEDMARALSDAKPISYELFAEASELFPGFSGAIARRQLAVQASNLTVTRLTGPADPLYMLGARLDAIFPVMPLVPRQGLRVAVLPYENQLHWGFNSDWDQMPDLHDLVQAAADGFEDLWKAVEARAARPKKKTGQAMPRP